MRRNHSSFLGNSLKVVGHINQLVREMRPGILKMISLTVFYQKAYFYILIEKFN